MSDARDPKFEPAFIATLRGRVISEWEEKAREREQRIAANSGNQISEISESVVLGNKYILFESSQYTYGFFEVFGENICCLGIKLPLGANAYSEDQGISVDTANNIARDYLIENNSNDVTPDSKLRTVVFDNDVILFEDTATKRCFGIDFEGTVKEYHSAEDFVLPRA